MDAAPAKLVRQATLNGKFYWNSDACPPRERIEIEGDDIPIVVQVIAPAWLHDMCSLKESGPEENPTWKTTGVPAGRRWMIDVIWANLTHAKREEIEVMYKKWLDLGSDIDSYIQYWLCIQLDHNWGECFTQESKEKVKDFYHHYYHFHHLCAIFKDNHLWMLIPREVTW